MRSISSAGEILTKIYPDSSAPGQIFSHYLPRYLAMASHDVRPPSGTVADGTPSANPDSIAPQMSSKTTDASRLPNNVGNNDAELVSNPQDGKLAKFPESPTEAAKGVKSGADLLRRLSLVGSSKPVAPSIEPQEGHPGLHLTGRIISAAFCIPYKLRIRPGHDWVWASHASTFVPFLRFQAYFSI